MILPAQAMSWPMIGAYPTRKRGCKELMKKNISFAVIAVLATALVLPHVGSADAATVEDGRKQLSPKSFGAKNTMTVSSINDSDSTHKAGLDTVKKEQVKTFKKVSEQYKALDFAKKYYVKLG